MTLTASTLFSGGGGADIGLIQAGFDILWGIEKDEAIAQSYELNFPDHRLIVDDIKNVDPTELEPADLIHASPPCQQYSSARRGDLPRHQEADAGLAIASYLEVLRPQFFTLENVPGYVKSESFQFIADLLHKLGYWTHWDIYDATSFGVPSDRKRLFLRASRVAFFPAISNPAISKSEDRKSCGWYQAIADLIPELPDSELADWQIPVIEKNRHRPLLIPRAGANLDTVGARQAHQPSPTIRAFKKWRGTHWADIVLRRNLIKRITPQATARLMSFPDSYLFPSASISQAVLGNAVPPKMMKAIAKSFVCSSAPVIIGKSYFFCD